MKTFKAAEAISELPLITHLGLKVKYRERRENAKKVATDNNYCGDQVKRY